MWNHLSPSGNDRVSGRSFLLLVFRVSLTALIPSVLGDLWVWAVLEGGGCGVWGRGGWGGWGVAVSA